jgi:hypothetical protein
MLMLKGLVRWMVAMPLILVACAPSQTTKQAVPAYDGPIETLAYLPAYTKYEDTAASFGDAVQNVLLNHPYIAKRFDLVERARIDTILGEQRFSATQGVDSQNAPGIGKLLGVRYVLLGELVNFSTSRNYNNVLGASVTTVTVYAKVGFSLVDVETGRILTRVSAEHTETVPENVGVSLGRASGGTTVSPLEKTIFDVIYKAVYAAVNQLVEKLAS